jgi:hypothetical protein
MTQETLCGGAISTFDQMAINSWPEESKVQECGANINVYTLKGTDLASHIHIIVLIQHQTHGNYEHIKR